MGAYLLQLETSNASTSSLIQAAREIAGSPYVDYVEANQRVRLNRVLPNDPLFSESYGFHNDGRKGKVLDADIDAPEAWGLVQGQELVETTVAVIDTGIDYRHPDLRNRIWINPGESGTDEQGQPRSSNGVDDDQNGYVDDWRGWNFVAQNNDAMDDQGHGTHCAGIIGAKGQNGIGIAGVNWQVKMVLSSFWMLMEGEAADAIKAIEYVSFFGFDISNNSWGGGGYSESLMRAIAASGRRGSLFVAAAGNDSLDNDRFPHYPSNYDLPNVISVAATDAQNQLAGVFEFWQAHGAYQCTW